MLIHIGMIVTGIVAVFWGLPAAHRLKSPLDIAAALVTLAGVVIALIGVLLTTAPGFFQG
jgi:hypothetical membrane protein